MTKREHEELQKLMNKSIEYSNQADKYFKRLQELNATEGTGTRWCSAADNTKDLLSVGKDYLYLYLGYVEARAKDEELWELGGVLAELNFWKNK